jgi:hypothetical protein
MKGGDGTSHWLGYPLLLSFSRSIMAIYVPGYGLKTDDELAINAACRAYDSDLVFQRSERTGNYTIFQRLMRHSPYIIGRVDELEGGDLFPVCGFPNRRMPAVDEVKKWLHQNDEMRRNTLDEVEKRNRKTMDAADAHTREAGHEAALRLARLAYGGEGFSAPNTGKRRR